MLEEHLTVSHSYALMRALWYACMRAFVRCVRAGMRRVRASGADLSKHETTETRAWTMQTHMQPSAR